MSALNCCRGAAAKLDLTCANCAGETPAATSLMACKTSWIDRFILLSVTTRIVFNKDKNGKYRDTKKSLKLFQVQYFHLTNLTQSCFNCKPMEEQLVADNGAASV